MEPTLFDFAEVCDELGEGSPFRAEYIAEPLEESRARFAPDRVKRELMAAQLLTNDC